MFAWLFRKRKEPLRPIVELHAMLFSHSPIDRNVELNSANCASIEHTVQHQPCAWLLCLSMVTIVEFFSAAIEIQLVFALN